MNRCWAVWEDALRAGAQAKVRTSARLVFVALAKHADETGRCYPSRELLAELTGLDQSQVRKDLRVLEQAGLMVKEPGHIGRGHSNRYRLVLGAVSTKGGTGASLSTDELSTKGGTGARKGGTGARDREAPVPPNNQLKYPKNGAAAAAAGPTDAGRAEIVKIKLARSKREPVQPGLPGVDDLAEARAQLKQRFDPIRAWARERNIDLDSVVIPNGGFL